MPAALAGVLTASSTNALTSGSSSSQLTASSRTHTSESRNCTWDVPACREAGAHEGRLNRIVEVWSHLTGEQHERLVAQLSHADRYQFGGLQHIPLQRK